MGRLIPSRLSLLAARLQCGHCRGRELSKPRRVSVSQRLDHDLVDCAPRPPDGTLEQSGTGRWIDEHTAAVVRIPAAFYHAATFESLHHSRDGGWFDPELFRQRGLSQTGSIPHREQEEVLTRVQSVRSEECPESRAMRARQGTQDRTKGARRTQPSPGSGDATRTVVIASISTPSASSTRMARRSRLRQSGS